jgi:Holliday junction resolvasome RuvABC endonuclease subunit
MPQEARREAGGGTVRVLAIDPSLGHTAMVVLDPGLGRIEMSTVYDYPHGLGGTQAVLEAFPLVDDWIFETMCLVVKLYAVDLVVHEMPPSSAKVMRPESALLASASVRRCAQGQGLKVVGLDARRAKRLVVGNPNATKADIRQWMTAHRAGWTSLTNEHKRDAALVGLAWWLEDQDLNVTEWLTSVA